MSGRRNSPAWDMINEMSGVETGAGMLQYLSGPMTGFVRKVEAVLDAQTARIAALEARVTALEGKKRGKPRKRPLMIEGPAP